MRRVITFGVNETLLDRSADGRRGRMFGKGPSRRATVLSRSGILGGPGRLVACVGSAGLSGLCMAFADHRLLAICQTCGLITLLVEVSYSKWDGSTTIVANVTASLGVRSHASEMDGSVSSGSEPMRDRPPARSV